MPCHAVADLLAERSLPDIPSGTTIKLTGRKKNDNTRSQVQYIAFIAPRIWHLFLPERMVFSPTHDTGATQCACAPSNSASGTESRFIASIPAALHNELGGTSAYIALQLLQNSAVGSGELELVVVLALFLALPIRKRGRWGV